MVLTKQGLARRLMKAKKAITPQLMKNREEIRQFRKIHAPGEGFIASKPPVLKILHKKA